VLENTTAKIGRKMLEVNIIDYNNKGDKMHQNQIGLLLLFIYIIFAIVFTVLLLEKIKLNFWIKFILAILMILVWFYGFGVLIDLLIHDT
jgi:hypothetical protein